MPRRIPNSELHWKLGGSSISNRIHRKKTWPQYFEAVKKGRKKFDVRLADFACKPGDILVLEEWNPKTKKYTGRKIRKKVFLVVKTKELKFWPKKEIQKHGFQILSLK